MCVVLCEEWTMEGNWLLVGDRVLIGDMLHKGVWSVKDTCSITGHEL